MIGDGVVGSRILRLAGVPCHHDASDDHGGRAKLAASSRGLELPCGEAPTVARPRELKSRGIARPELRRLERECAAAATRRRGKDRAVADAVARARVRRSKARDLAPQVERTFQARARVRSERERPSARDHPSGRMARAAEVAMAPRAVDDRPAALRAELDLVLLETVAVDDD